MAYGVEHGRVQRLHVFGPPRPPDPDPIFPTCEAFSLPLMALPREKASDDFWIRLAVVITRLHARPMLGSSSPRTNLQLLRMVAAATTGPAVLCAVATRLTYNLFASEPRAALLSCARVAAAW